MTGELWSIIQAHLDRYGVYEAVFARRMGTKPQTINTWKNLGVKRLPERRLLEAVARETGTPYAAVLKAALVDTGYLPASAITDGLEASSDPVPVDAAQPEPHSTTVTAADIAAGVGLPLAAPRHRHTAPSSDTTRTPHR
jgi:hypothetical protein